MKRPLVLLIAFAFACHGKARQQMPVQRPALSQSSAPSARPLPEGPFVHPLYIYPRPQHHRPDDIVVHPEHLAVVLERVAPKIPEVAKRARVSGIVIVEVLIERNGRVSRTKVLKSLPFGLDQAAVDAVRQWKFRPAYDDGRPVRSFFKVTVNMRA